MAQSIEQVYVEHHHWLKNWLACKVSCPSLAADLMQDTFERLIRRAQSPSDMRQPKAYLTQIAKGLMIDYWRRRDLEQAYLEALAMQPEAETLCEQTRYELFETLLIIDRALKKLPHRTREVFLKVQLDGTKYKSLAQHYGVSERTIKTDVANALLACLQAEEVSEVQ